MAQPHPQPDTYPPPPPNPPLPYQPGQVTSAKPLVVAILGLFFVIPSLLFSLPAFLLGPICFFVGMRGLFHEPVDRSKKTLHMISVVTGGLMILIAMANVIFWFYLLVSR